MPTANIHTFKVSVPKKHGRADNDESTVAAPILERSSSEHLQRNAADSRPIDVEYIHPASEKVGLPSYITPLPSRIDQDVRQLLYRKGALNIPREGTINDLLKGFICFVYPMLPVLDLDSFLGAIRGTSGKSISLLLFQAILMAGATFADFSSLQDVEFQSFEDAQMILFERVKLLCELDTESDPTTMIQVLLLMTCWDGRAGETKERFYWLGIAMSLATDMGLNTAQQKSDDQPEQQRLRRRLWACCMTRSHLLSLAERRQVHLSGVRGFQALSPDDLEDVALTRALEQYSLSSRDTDAQVTGRLFLRLVKLCSIVRRIFKTQYELMYQANSGFGVPSAVLIPKKTASGEDIIARDRELRKWYAETSSIEDAAFGQDHRPGGTTVGAHSATLELLYLTALSTVHQSHLSHNPDTGSAAGALQAFSSVTLRSAAHRILNIGRQLEEGNLVQFLPSSAIGAFITACLQHLDDAISNNPEISSAGALYMMQTLDAFAGLKRKYNSIDPTISFMEHVKNGAISHTTVPREEISLLMSGWLDRRPSQPIEEMGNGIAAGTNGLLHDNAETSGVPRSIDGNRAISSDGFDDGNHALSTPYLLVPNLEGFSEELISSMYRPDGDSRVG